MKKIIILQKRLSLEGIQGRYDKVIDISGEDFSLSRFVEKRKRNEEGNIEKELFDNNFNFLITSNPIGF
ncbi:MAG: hypothetical protein RAO94_06325 [Candidatus Stygibacter australis]|nr:hypothetical protein [Candidatus Stygibacter australis]MDP8321947.1 hypothetical protein [Candidatus Stygibacter australis]